MSRRGALTLLALAGLPGCTRRTPAPAGGGPATIHWFAFRITNSHLEPRHALIDAFRRAYPWINVELVSAPTSTDQGRDALHDMISGDDRDGTPDVYLGDVIWPAEFAENRLALPLDNLFPPAFWSRFPAELVQAASYHGRTYAAPFYADQGVLLYRKDLLAEEHLPNPPETWEELATAARTLLHRKRVEQGFVWQGARYEGLTCVWTEFSAEARRPGNAPPAGGRDPLVDTPRSLAALTFMRSLLTSGVSPIEVTRWREAQALQAFESGQAAFLRAWNSAYFDAAELSDSRVHGRVGVAPLPTFAGEQGPGASTIGGWSLFINPRTRHLREAVNFIDWMTATPAQLTLAQYSVSPTNEDVRADKEVTDNPVLAAAAKTRPVRRPSATPKYRQVSEVIHTQVHRALLGELSPQAALREAQRRIDEII